MSAASDGALQALAPALGRVPSGLFILTACHESKETGMLVSWVQQCSFEPPQLSLCVRFGRDVLAWLANGACFTLSQLAEGQNALVSHFAKGFDEGEPAFTGINVERREGKAPILLDALAHLDCRVASRIPCGDHELLIAAVVGGRLLSGDCKPLVHVRKNGLRY
jgi:flavin reductase (DIM6/NTAB) family NADH-FMN oxidoreductase RutF